MLIKLLKYDLKSYYKKLLPLWAFVLVSSITGGIIQRLIVPIIEKYEVLQFLFTLLVGVFYVSIVVLVIFTAFLLIHRFYTNVLKAEGYLTNTLPVKKSTIINAKLLSALIVGFATAIFLDLVLFIFNLISIDFDAASRIFSSYFDLISSGYFTLALSILVMIILSSLSGLLLFYASLALGFSKSNSKMLWSVVFYFIINMATTIISVIMAFVFVEFFDSFGFDDLSENTILMIITTACNIFLIVYGAILYALTLNGIKNKLNLE